MVPKLLSVSAVKCYWKWHSQVVPSFCENKFLLAFHGGEGDSVGRWFKVILQGTLVNMSLTLKGCQSMNSDFEACSG